MNHSTGKALLVATKFAPPRLGARSVQREALLKYLQQMRECRLTSLVASPGFGKTTLLAQWRQALLKEGADVAWLSLSIDDRQLSTYCAYLQSAIEQLGVNLDGSIALDVTSGDGLDERLAEIVGQIAEVNRELFLIIDDYQHVTDPRAHRLMQKLLEHCPANLHLALASRMALPLSLGKLRVMGQVVEIDGDNLPFGHAEVRQFFDGNLTGVSLSSDELHQINELTNGWPASLQLILLMLKNNPDARAQLRDLAWKSDDLQAYLSEDVMQHLPGELAQFMESLSLCRRFNAALATELSGRDDALELLRRMDEENILTFRVDTPDRRSWYRFHPLFGEFLTTRLSRRGESVIIELHRRAARWLGSHGHLAEAVRHALQCGDHELAAELVEQVTRRPLEMDYVRPLLRLLNRLPREVLLKHPNLFCLYCLCYAVSAQPEKAQAYLDQLDETDIHANAALRHNLPLMRAAIAVQQDETDQVVQWIKDYAPLPSDHALVRYMPLTLMSQAYAGEGRFDEAMTYFDNFPIALDHDDEVALLSENARLLCLSLQGRTRDVQMKAPDLLARAISLYGYGSVASDLCAATVAEAYREQNRLDDARETLANRFSIMSSMLPSIMLRTTLCRARLNLLQEPATQTLVFLERQERHFLRSGQERVAAHLQAEQIRIAVELKDTALASSILERLDGLARRHSDARGFRAEIPVQATLAKARLLRATGYPQEALSALEFVADFARRRSSGQLHVTVLLLMALAQDDLRHRSEAEGSLLHALQLGEELGLVRTFLDEGAQVQKLLLRLPPIAQDDPSCAYLESLLRHFSLPAQAGLEDADGAGTTAASAPSTPLTPREIAILQLIGETMSNKRIALTLNISLETVKWNLKNIYVKLGVSSRYDALSWARKHRVV